MDILIFTISIVASFVFALGGIGGAIILVPILITIGIPINTARPTGLFYNIVGMTSATVSNIKNKRLNFRQGIPIIISSFLFAVVGAYSSKFINDKIILILFILFLLISGLMFLFHKKKEGVRYKEKASFTALFLIGAFAGLLSGILGIGGGGIISPLMLMTGLDPKKSAVTTAFVVPFSSLSGFLTYWAMGQVDWRLLLIVSTAGVIGATFGTAFMHKKLNSEAVKKILSVMLLLMAGKLLMSVI